MTDVRKTGALLLVLAVLAFTACGDDPAKTVVVEYHAVKDACIISSHPLLTCGGELYLWTGFYISGNRVFRSLLMFDPAIVSPGARLVKAQLVLTVIDSPTDSTGTNTIAAYALTNAWSEGSGYWNAAINDADVSWQCYDFPNAWITAGGDFREQAVIDQATIVLDLSGDDLVTLDLDLDLVRDWIDNPSGNHGILLKDNVESGIEHFLAFYSRESPQREKRPKLVLTLEL